MREKKFFVIALYGLCWLAALCADVQVARSQVPATSPPSTPPPAPTQIASKQTNSSQAASPETTTPANEDRYWLVLDGGVGVSAGRSEYVSPTADVNRTVGLVGLLRLKLVNHDFFSIGVETGLQHIVEQRINNSRVTVPNAARTGDTTLVTDIRGWLAGIPIMVVLCVEAYNVSVHAGLGYYSIFSHAELLGGSVSSLGFDWAGALSLGYTFRLPNDSGVMLEARAVRLIDNQRALLSLQARLFLPVVRF